MSITFAGAGLSPSCVRLSCLVLISLTSCARADPPELFVSDPALQNDYLNSLPTHGSSNGYEYEIVQGQAVLEGDILLGMVDSNGRLASLRGRGIGTTSQFLIWPDGIIPYERPVNNSLVQQANVDEAIAHWSEHTTLKFVERTSENADQYNSYLRFTDSMGCASNVGKIGGPQAVYISDACSVGSVIHEIGHAVGLFHEHTRPDRDNFVTIDWDEIVADKHPNFALQTQQVATYSPYDYGSIMHYGAYFFSKSGAAARPTIIVDAGIEIGQREALSLLDIVSINNMYQTDLALESPSFVPTDAGLEINLSAYNYGNLGAHDLQLLVRLGEDSRWKGYSSNSGWLCLTYEEELKCTRDTMREQTESRLIVLADAGSATQDDLSVQLTSHTQDSDPSNNAINADDIQWKSVDVQLVTAADEDINKELESTSVDEPLPVNAPILLAASATPGDTANADPAPLSSAGRIKPLTLLALILFGIKRRFLK